MHFSQKYMYAMEGLWTEGHNNSCHALTGAKHVMQVVLRYFISIHTHTHTHTRTHTHTHTHAHTHTHTRTHTHTHTHAHTHSHTHARTHTHTHTHTHTVQSSLQRENMCLGTQPNASVLINKKVSFKRIPLYSLYFNILFLGKIAEGTLEVQRVHHLNHLEDNCHR